MDFVLLAFLVLRKVENIINDEAGSIILIEPNIPEQSARLFLQR
ncbi:MAG: hypothetical protein PF570_02665 [Candidatus Cloacimonetes bacterium]|jgi:hypothetical protein|nr:hypothetical protein [Candidatus Cloacimonadota bacterium]